MVGQTACHGFDLTNTWPINKKIKPLYMRLERAGQRRIISLPGSRQPNV